MKILGVIFVLFALSFFADGQWVAAARGLYQPVLLSIGATFTVINNWRKFSDEEHDYEPDRFKSPSKHWTEKELKEAEIKEIEVD